MKNIMGKSPLDSGLLTSEWNEAPAEYDYRALSAYMHEKNKHFEDLTEEELSIFKK